MRVCGIEIKGNEVHLAILVGTKDDIKLENVEPRKIKLADDTNSNDVKNFRDTIFAFFHESKLDTIAIKKRNKKGDFSGGPIGFKLEGIIQLYDDCKIELVSANSIAAIKKKNRIILPDELRKYQYIAFETAFTILLKVK